MRDLADGAGRATLRRGTVLFLLVLVACGGGSPAEPPAIGSVPLLPPFFVQRGEVVTFSLAFDLEDGHRWDEVLMTVELPGIIRHDDARVVDTDADEVVKGAAGPAGEFDFDLRWTRGGTGGSFAGDFVVTVRDDAQAGLYAGVHRSVVDGPGGRQTLALPLGFQVLD